MNRRDSEIVIRVDNAAELQHVARSILAGHISLRLPRRAEVGADLTLVLTRENHEPLSVPARVDKRELRGRREWFGLAVRELPPQVDATLCMMLVHAVRECGWLSEAPEGPRRRPLPGTSAGARVPGRRDTLAHVEALPGADPEELVRTRARPVLASELAPPLPPPPSPPRKQAAPRRRPPPRVTVQGLGAAAPRPAVPRPPTAAPRPALAEGSGAGTAALADAAEPERARSAPVVPPRPRMILPPPPPRPTGPMPSPALTIPPPPRTDASPALRLRSLPPTPATPHRPVRPAPRKRAAREMPAAAVPSRRWPQLLILAVVVVAAWSAALSRVFAAGPF